MVQRKISEIPDWEQFITAIAFLMVMGLIFLCIELLFKNQNPLKEFWNEIKTDYPSLIMFCLMVLYGIKTFFTDIGKW